MTKVKNLNGTSDNYPPKGYSTWKAYWEYKTGKKFNTCSCEKCTSSATVGAHVQKVVGTDKWYIVPLCTSCNVSKKNQEFSVRDDDLVPATT